MPNVPSDGGRATSRTRPRSDSSATSHSRNERSSSAERSPVTSTRTSTRTWLQQLCCQQKGFRNWARLPARTPTAMERIGRARVDQEVLRWAFSRLGSGT
ncbi:hypothetical protein CTZ28_39570 [Streptomyces shenzhenensis]|uniref:Uncharacterized protein n=1 Tax=Streptomyces shenzhenensis TaxID=943815 RepID=A0A3M0HVB7_9ACTN|nr:hypothetical protein CTZ28_39570 [Streptomyces shenzhenensis]